MPIVNIKTQPCDVYVGRQNNKTHFGNPFSHIAHSTIKHVVATREEAVSSFEKWILGEAHEDVEPDRLLWILENLHTLKGKTLGCWCAPKACHASVLERLANEWVP